jgi:hypothetical protein
MIARRKSASRDLVVTFEREGEPPVRITVSNGRRALMRSVDTLITTRELRAGDRLTIEAAE